MEEKVYEVSLGQLFRVALKHWWIILIATVLGAVIAFTYVNFFVAPTYSTYAKVGINSEGMSDYQGEIAGNYTARSGADILVSNITLERAADKLNADPNVSRKYSADKLLSMLKTNVSNESKYFDVKVSSTDPVEAKVVCEAIIGAFCDVLAEENVMSSATGIVIHRPVVPTAPSSPNKTLTIVLGALVGFVLSFGTILVVYFAKDALDGEDWLIETYRDKIPMLAVIPDANNAGRTYRKYQGKYGYGYK